MGQLLPSPNEEWSTLSTEEATSNSVTYNNYGELINIYTLTNNNIIDSNGQLINSTSSSAQPGPLHKGILLNVAGAIINNNENAVLVNASIINNIGVLNYNLGSTLINRGSGILTNESASSGNSGGYLLNMGTIDNSDNSLGAKGFINNGTYQGTGQIKGSWTDHGTVKPGSSAGGMLIDGHYYKKDGSKEIELGGTYHGDGDRT